MKHFYLITIACFFLLLNALAQKPAQAIMFKNGRTLIGPNLLKKKIGSQPFSDLRWGHTYYLLVQFDQLPGVSEKNEMQQRGVHLYDYVSGNAFLAEITDSADLQSLRSYHANGAYALPLEFKISSKLSSLHLEVKSENNPLVAVTFYGAVNKETVKTELAKAGAQILFTKIQPEHVVFVNASL